MRISLQKRWILYLLLLVFCTGSFQAPLFAAAKTAGEDPVDLDYIIVIDPGHGGMDTGAAGYGKTESKRTLTLAKYLKKDLESYEHVKVYLTREKDTWVNLHDRMRVARQKKADLMVSLHFDSYSEGAAYSDGASIFTAKRGSYRLDIVTLEVRLARTILSEIEKLGIENRGLVRKRSPNVPPYPDGSQGDYAAIVRDGMRAGIPSILIEHAFIDDYEDYRLVLSSKARMKKLAHADAVGIARYLQLTKKSSGLKPGIYVHNGESFVVDSDRDSQISLVRKKAILADYDRIMEEGALRFQAEKDKRFERNAEEFADERSQMAHQILNARRGWNDRTMARDIVISLAMAFILFWILEDTRERYGPSVDWEAVHARNRRIARKTAHILGLCREKICRWTRCGCDQVLVFAGWSWSLISSFCNRAVQMAEELVVWLIRMAGKGIAGTK